MDFPSFLQNNKNNNGGEQDISQTEGGQAENSQEDDVNFLKSIDESELEPVPKKNRRSAKSRLSDQLISAPPEDVILPSSDAEKRMDSLIGQDEEEEEESPSSFKKFKEEFFKFFNKVKNKLEERKVLLQKKKKDEVIGVNLVKDEIIQFFDWQKNVLYLLVAIFISLFVVSLGYWGISWWSNGVKVEKDQFMAQDYYRINKQLRELEPQVQEIKIFQERLNKADFLLERHIYWTNFFDFLERNTLADVYFSSFSGNTGGGYTLNAKGRYFEVLDAQKKKFLEDEVVTSAKITGGSVVASKGGGQEGIAFNIEIKIDPRIFYK